MEERLKEQCISGFGVKVERALAKAFVVWDCGLEFGAVASTNTSLQFVHFGKMLLCLKKHSAWDPLSSLRWKL